MDAHIASLFTTADSQHFIQSEQMSGRAANIVTIEDWLERCVSHFVSYLFRSFIHWRRIKKLREFRIERKSDRRISKQKCVLFFIFWFIFKMFLYQFIFCSVSDNYSSVVSGENESYIYIQINCLLWKILVHVQNVWFVEIIYYFVINQFVKRLPLKSNGKAIICVSCLFISKELHSLSHKQTNNGEKNFNPSMKIKPNICARECGFIHLIMSYLFKH